MNNTISKELIDKCLYNWLGYGNINSKIWFIGTEESGVEIWKEKTKTLLQSLEIRSKFNTAMDLIDVWENKYNVNIGNLLKKATTWRFIAAFMLYFYDNNISRKDISEAVNKYITLDKCFGGINSNHFLLELYPLPKRSKNDISDYNKRWKSNSDYIDEVKVKRFNLIAERLKENKNVSLIVSYDKTAIPLFLDTKYFRADDKINIASINVDSRRKKLEINKLKYDNRDIFLLSTPFFGNGWMSYDLIKKAVGLLKKKRIF